MRSNVAIDVDLHIKEELFALNAVIRQINNVASLKALVLFWENLIRLNRNCFLLRYLNCSFISDIKIHKKRGPPPTVMPPPRLKYLDFKPVLFFTYEHLNS